MLMFSNFLSNLTETQLWLYKSCNHDFICLSVRITVSWSASVEEILVTSSATPQSPSKHIYGIKILCCHILKLSHSQNLTSDLGLKITEIWTSPRVLVEAPMLSISDYYATSFFRLLNVKTVSMLPTHPTGEAIP